MSKSNEDIIITEKSCLAEQWLLAPLWLRQKHWTEVAVSDPKCWYSKWLKKFTFLF